VIKLISDEYGAKLTPSILSLFTAVNGRLVRKINCKALLGQFVENLANRRTVLFTKISCGFAG
jgi:hypothetical protein